MENLPVSDFDIVLPQAHAALLSRGDDASAAPQAPPAQHTSAAPVGSVNLLDWDGDDAAHGSAAAQPSAQARFELSAAPAVNPADFQAAWNALPETFSGAIGALRALPGTVTEIETVLCAGKVLLSCTFVIFLERK
jgi:hypothetical protein